VAAKKKQKKNGGLCSAHIRSNLHPLKWTKSESNSLSSGPRFPKQHRYLEGSQALPIRLSDKRNMYTNMSIMHWWNNNDTGKPNYSQRNLFQWLLFTIYLTWTDLWSKPGLRGDRPATNCLCTAQPI